jgi:membrane protein DedA with SNARE-associated domain
MTRWVLDFISATGYFGIVVLMFVENIFPPIPSEFIMPLAGFLVFENEFSFFAVVLAGTFGSVLGALPLYFTGAKIGEEKLKKFADTRGRWFAFSSRDIERANLWFDKYGIFAVLICRLIPGIRSLISIPAGINRMNIFSFLFFTTLGAGIWTTVLTGAGYILESNFQEIENYLDPVVYIVLISIVVLYLIRVFRHKK